MPFKNKDYQRKYEQIWHEEHPEYDKKKWQENKNRYDDRWIGRLGNPAQDDEISKALKNKKKHKPLPDEAFLYNNQAQADTIEENPEWGEEYTDQDDW